MAPRRKQALIVIGGKSISQSAVNSENSLLLFSWLAKSFGHCGCLSALNQFLWLFPTVRNTAMMAEGRALTTTPRCIRSATADHTS